MRLSITAALLPIVLNARGDNNGVDRENAFEVTLVDNEQGTLKLYTYNADNDGTMELHGDLWLRYGSADSRQTGFARFGFCLEQPDTVGDGNLWDCMRVSGQVDPDYIAELPGHSKDFEIYDAQKGANETDLAGTDFSVMTLDAGWQTTGDASQNWRGVNSKSFKNGCTATDLKGRKIVKCDELDAHFYRNFETNSDTQDLQLAEALKGTKTRVVGFFGFAQDKELTSDILSPYQGEVQEINLVSETFFDPDFVPEENNGDKGENNDGATGVTMFATALIAAISTLAF